VEKGAVHGLECRVIRFIRRNRMKQKEIVDDEAIKMASKTQRHIKQADFLEMEDPAEYARIAEIKSGAYDEFGKRQKQEAREDREKNEKAREAFLEKRKETEEDK
jgi:hypothetical protein